MTAQDYLVASHWQNSLEKLMQYIARIEKDLAEYEQKPEAKQNVISIRRQGLQIIENFVCDTEDLLLLQRDKVKFANTLEQRHKTLLHDHQVLRNYAASKGLDLSLLQYMTLKDR